MRPWLVLFFALAYAISWASFQLLHGPSLFTLGPLLAALLLAAVTGGGTGLRMLASRMLRWRIRPIWMAAAWYGHATSACPRPVYQVGNAVKAWKI